MKERYFLLPFSFMRLGDKEILVNELGTSLWLPRAPPGKLWSAPLTMRS